MDRKRFLAMDRAKRNFLIRTLYPIVSLNEICKVIEEVERGNFFEETAEFICVIDFEATCLENCNEFYPHEIIEFPAVMIDCSTKTIVSTFHSYVRPSVNPVLSDFCKNLTGISQDDVDNSEYFGFVLSRFTEWLYKTTSGSPFKILTDGTYDMAKFLYLQCLISHKLFPSWAENFIDVKQTFKTIRNKEKAKLVDMLDAYGLKFEGQLHSGKDDAHNIARLTIAILSSESLSRLECNAKVHPATKKSLQRHLTSYFRKEQCKERARDRELCKKRKSQTVEETAAEFLDRLMDVDPDLVGCEDILLSHKSNRNIMDQPSTSTSTSTSHAQPAKKRGAIKQKKGKGRKSQKVEESTDESD